MSCVSVMSLRQAASTSGVLAMHRRPVAVRRACSLVELPPRPDLAPIRHNDGHGALIQCQLAGSYLYLGHLESGSLAAAASGN